MPSSTLKEAGEGAALALVGFMLLSTSVPIPVQASTSSGYWFTMTIVAPTSKPSRRQWAAIIAQNLRSIGIDARLVYTTFGVMAGISFGCSSPCYRTFWQGGYDAIVVGFGGGTLLPDWGTQNVLIYRSLTNSDYAPNGANFLFYHNDTYNQLAQEYQNTFNATKRYQLAPRMVAIVAQDRPDLPVYTPVDVYAQANYINQWGDNTSETTATANRDFQHWSLSKGDAINIAEQGTINSVNQWVTSESNDYFDAYLYNPTMANLEEVDARSLKYTNALATSITGSADHLTWTVKFTPHEFQDGVPVTSDDYLFSMMGSIVNSAGSVNAPILQGLLGAYGGKQCNCTGIRFVYLNGTSDYVWNGNYSHINSPPGFVKTSEWTAADQTTFSFTLKDTYLFTDPVLTGIPAQPMHIFERIPFAVWNISAFATLHSTPYVYAYNQPGQADHGGNGSATAYGPIGDGPYYYHGYNVTSGVGTLTKWGGYWNATGLENLGLFNADVIHVVRIPASPFGDVEQAIKDFALGKVNFIDSNYDFAFNKTGIAIIGASGGRITQRGDPAGGWQDFVLNNRNPFFGTGVATPFGQSDPVHAERYARFVREAISHAIPRQQIIDSFIEGIGLPGITEFCTCFTYAYPSNVTVDRFDLDLSRALLAKAGYSASAPAIEPPPSPPPFTCGSSNPPQQTGKQVSIPSFIAGNTLMETGTFGITPSVGSGTGGFYATLQESTDNGTSWYGVALDTTTEAGYYSFSYDPTITGEVWYRVFFTGIPATSDLGATGASNPSAAEAYVLPQTRHNGESNLNMTDTRYSTIAKLDVGTFSQAIGDSLAAGSSLEYASIDSSMCGIWASINATLQKFENETAKTFAQPPTVSRVDLQTATDSINARINSISYVTYAAIIAAVVLDSIAIVVSRRRTRPANA